MQRDITHFASGKLQGGWSAADFAKFLTQDNLRALLPKFEKLEPLVRVRLLLSVLSLDSRAKQILQAELQELQQLARADKDEWVSITAKALGSFHAPLDFSAVLAGSNVVKATTVDLQNRLETSESSAFRPLEEIYLNTPIVESLRAGPEPAIEHSHFTSRDGGANNLPELYKRAAASATAAVASMQPPNSPAHQAFSHSGQHNVHPSASAHHRERQPGSSAQLPPPRSGFMHRPASSAGPASSGLSRPLAEDDMFRSSKPTFPSSRPSASTMTGQQGRKGMTKPVNVKLLPVNDVKKLNRSSLASPQHSSAAHTAPVKYKEDSAEEGEIEPGEFMDDAESMPMTKRPRHNAVMS